MIYPTDHNKHTMDQFSFPHKTAMSPVAQPSSPIPSPDKKVEVRRRRVKHSLWTATEDEFIKDAVEKELLTSGASSWYVYEYTIACNECTYIVLY